MQVGSIVEWAGDAINSEHILGYVPFKKDVPYVVVDLQPHTYVKHLLDSLHINAEADKGEWLLTDMHPDIWCMAKYFKELQPPQTVDIEAIIEQPSLV